MINAERYDLVLRAHDRLEKLCDEFETENARLRHSPQEEKQGTIEWLIDLRDELDKGNLKEVRDSITSAIKVVERENKCLDIQS